MKKHIKTDHKKPLNDLKTELIDLYYETSMGHITEDEAIEKLGWIQIESGLTPEQFIPKFYLIIKQLEKEL